VVKRAVIYCRFSPRPDADECDSNLGQEVRCKAYCDGKRYEYNPDYIFKDSAVSGGKRNRPGLDAAIAALQPGMVLVIDRNDRLARDMLVALTIHHEVEQLGCTIEFADGSPLRNTPEGKLFSNLLSAFAQFERERFALRTKDGMARKKAEGVWCGRPPIGWRKTKGSEKLTADKYEQKAISMAQHMHHLGFSSEAIAIDVQGECGPCRGKPWSARTIRRILARKPIVA
jgi:DNA invertase Pin-like site-specific DNA recombinase